MIIGRRRVRSALAMTDLVDVVAALSISNPDAGVKKLVKLVKETHPAVGTKVVREALTEGKARQAATAATAAEAAASAAAAEAKGQGEARAAAQAAAAAASLLKAPPGYVLRAKHNIPQPEQCDGIRQMCSEGGDEHEVASGDKICCQCGEPTRDNFCFHSNKSKKFKHNPADPAADEGNCCGDIACAICKAEYHCCVRLACDMCEGHTLKKSHGVNPNYWADTDFEIAYEDATLEKQFPDEWCESLTPDRLLVRKL